MTEQNPQIPILTKEERAFLIKNLWEALQVPSWTKDDLIELGKAIFAKKTLREMGVDEKLFARLFPLLIKITDHLGEKLVHAQNPPKFIGNEQITYKEIVQDFSHKECNTPPMPVSVQPTPVPPTIVQPPPAPVIAAPTPASPAQTPPTPIPPAPPLALVPLLEGKSSKHD